MSPGLLVVLLLAGKPAKAPPSPLAPVRAAVGKATPGCRDALAGPMAALEKALGVAASAEATARAQQVLTDVFGAADGAGCSDEVRRELAQLRQRLAGGGAETAPAPVETDRFDLALRTLEMAQRSMETPECEAAAAKHLERWIDRLHEKKANRAMAMEMRAKAKALAKECHGELTARIDAAAVNLLEPK